MRVYADSTATGPQLDAEVWAEGPLAHSVWAHVEGHGPRPVLVNIRTAGKYYVEPTDTSVGMSGGDRRRVEELHRIQQRASTARLAERRRVETARARRRWDACIVELPQHLRVRVRVGWEEPPWRSLNRDDNRTELWKYSADRARPRRLSAKRWRELAAGDKSIPNPTP